MSDHECTDLCRDWHRTHPVRGQKENSIPKGDPRHLNEIGKKHAEANRKGK